MKPYRAIQTCAVIRQLFIGKFIPEMTLVLAAVRGISVLNITLIIIPSDCL